jgi:hypothetical protein
MMICTMSVLTMRLYSLCMISASIPSHLCNTYAGLHVTMSAFRACDLHECFVVLIQGKEVVNQEAMCVHATAEGTAATPAAVPTVYAEQ